MIGTSIPKNVFPNLIVVMEDMIAKMALTKSNALFSFLDQKLSGNFDVTVYCCKTKS